MRASYGYGRLFSRCTSGRRKPRFQVVAPRGFAEARDRLLSRCEGKCRPQYWQIWPSRASTLRRFRWSFCFGSRSNSSSRITRGPGFQNDRRIQSSCGCLSSARNSLILAKSQTNRQEFALSNELLRPVRGREAKGASHIHHVNSHVEPMSTSTLQESAVLEGDERGCLRQQPPSRAFCP